MCIRVTTGKSQTESSKPRNSFWLSCLRSLALVLTEQNHQKDIFLEEEVATLSSRRWGKLAFGGGSLVLKWETWPGLGPSWAVLGRLGPILGPSWAVLGPSWAILGPSWGRLGRAWRRLGPSWAVLGPSWGHLGAVLGGRGAVLGAKMGMRTGFF